MRERKSDIYFRIALIVSQRSLQTEFANMFFLPQSKGVFLRLTHDRTVVCACGLLYHCSASHSDRWTKNHKFTPISNSSICALLWFIPDAVSLCKDSCHPCILSQCSSHSAHMGQTRDTADLRHSATRPRFSCCCSSSTVPWSQQGSTMYLDEHQK